MPALPAGLQCLDVRGCADLTALPALPSTLESLILDGCVGLETLPELTETALPQLTELSLKACVKVPETWIHRALAAAPALRHFDASGCSQLLLVLAWPANLDRIELNACLGLEALPEEWPAQLRRLGLRGVSALAQLPDFPDALDHIDLGETEGLRKLPDRRGRPRTLMLYGSGVLMPPASEHGKSADENVAKRTQAYFEDVELVGAGEVKRCKLLLLGNGSAGKTCLALRLTPGKEPKNYETDTTHGVQFWDWNFTAKVGGGMKTVHLHLWDFGGQEIYHNTHRLFMGKGAVFVLLWNPDQDGKQPAARHGYQDEWRPLQYWLDLIHLACPHRPRIAIVCSHRAKGTDQLERQWREQVSPNHHDSPRFYIDSPSGTGELAKLEEWLRKEVGQVVHTQGVAVPSHWEIAQDLVESWLPKPSSGATGTETARNELTPDVFRSELDGAIHRALKADTSGRRYPKLASALEGGTFALTPDRLHRTLDFLTHSGWVYWDRALFEQRIIIGQQWALDGIYTVLQRPTTGEGNEKSIYARLCNSHGQFTRKDLDQWGWAKRYTEPQQLLLISFMKAVGLCFELVRKGESLWGEPVFKTFEHLPDSNASGLQAQFDRHSKKGQAGLSVRSPRLHKGHWHALLKDLGEYYGTDAKYAADGFLVENQEGQEVYLVALFEPGNLGGEIIVRVAGPDAGKRADALVAKVRGFVPEAEGAKAEPAQEALPGGAAGSRIGKIRVFFSYARDPEPPVGYEEPVNALDGALCKHVEILRDREEIERGDNIVAFMQSIQTTDKVLIVHSDKYWRSPFCMYEFSKFMDSFVFSDRDERLNDVLILVEHTTSGFKKAKELQVYRDHWNEWDDMPSMLEDVTNRDKLKAAAVHALTNQVPKLAALLDLNHPWPTDREMQPKEIRWVMGLLGLPKQP